MTQHTPGAADHPAGESPSRVAPPGTWEAADHFLRAVESPWHRLLVNLADVLTRATVAHWAAHGVKALHLPLTTRTVTCPTGLGSDSSPVPVSIGGAQTFLADSMQFLLEYGCRAAPDGCYTMLPSFRAELLDQTHLLQFMHSEAEIPGGLDELIPLVESYIKHLAQSILSEYGGALSNAVGDVSHLERIAARDTPFTRMEFSEAASLLDGSGEVAGPPRARYLTRAAERLLMAKVGEFVWVTGFDHLSVPFYHAFADEAKCTAANADLFFGIGEIVGAGARHRTGDEVRQSLKMHGVPERDYAWYVRLKDIQPMWTAGFGLGSERFLLWVLGHDDIRDIPLVPRFPEEPGFPDSVDYP